LTIHIPSARNMRVSLDELASLTSSHQSYSSLAIAIAIAIAIGLMTFYGYGYRTQFV
jgi:hypothetical protein